MLTKKIKILEVEPNSEIGGVTYFIFQIIKYLPQAQFDVLFVAGGNGPSFQFLRQCGANTYSLPVNYSIVSIFSAINILRKFLQEKEVDILHAHTVKSGLLAVLAARGTATKVIFTAHGWRFLQIRNPFKRAVLYLIEKYIVSSASAVTYLTQGEYNIGTHEVPQQKEQHVIPLSLNISEYEKKTGNSFREHYKIPEDSFAVAMVGRMVYQKDPETFLKIAEIVSAKIPRSVFIWIGNNSDYSSQKTKHVVVTGQITHEGVVAGLHSSDMMLFTSRYEGLPIAVLEAMAASLPVVAANVSGVPEIVKEGKTGLLFEKGNVYEGVEKIIELYNDSYKRKQYAEEALRLVEQDFSPVEKSSRAFAALYKKIHETDN